VNILSVELGGIVAVGMRIPHCSALKLLPGRQVGLQIMLYFYSSVCVLRSFVVSFFVSFFVFLF
jgi:hypothetical protein